METQSIDVAEVDGGIGTPVPEPVAEVAAGAVAPPDDSSEAPIGPPAGYENIPPELWPDKDGKSPELTPRMIKQLRGKYFTVRHAHGECGHAVDIINQPKNNCHACWLVFFTTHPQLVEVAHQFYRTQGKKPMVAMRGEKFVKMFEKYMALLYQMHLERKKQEELKRVVENTEPGSVGSVGSTSGDNLTGETSTVSEG